MTVLSLAIASLAEEFLLNFNPSWWRAGSWPRLDIRLPAVQSLGLEGFFPALTLFYLSLGFSSKVTP